VLRNSLSDIPGITLLRSDLILEDLLQALFKPPNSSLNSTFSEAVHKFHPNRFRRNDLEAACKCFLEDGYTSDYPLDFVDNLFDRFFEINGSFITARDGNAENYSALIRHVHPFSIVGYRCARYMQEGSLSLKDLRKFASHITPLAIKRRCMYKDYAENHIHLGGSYEPHGSLLNIANQDRTDEHFYEDVFLSKLPHLTDFPLVTGRQYTIGQLIDLFKEVHTALNSAVFFNDFALSSSIASIRAIE